MLNNLLMVAGTEGATTSTALTNAFTTAANDMTAQITAITPIALGVVTAGLVVTFGVKFFKRITGKA